jgi:NAD(P)-dependent dehydrogenase (short-subunit alcohol dehydrogenase family)
VAYPGIAGKVAIVTGAAGGIGKALVVDAFVKEDLRVVALDIDEKGVRALQDKHGDAKVLGLRVDVSDPEDCRRQVATVAERLGTVHILVNNAALGMNSGADAYDDEHLQIEDVPDDLWRGSLPSTWGAPSPRRARRFQFNLTRQPRGLNLPSPFRRCASARRGPAARAGCCLIEAYLHLYN